jgi:hypothetical protein
LKVLLAVLRVLTVLSLYRNSRKAVPASGIVLLGMEADGFLLQHAERWLVILEALTDSFNSTILAFLEDLRREGT